MIYKPQNEAYSMYLAAYRNRQERLDLLREDTTRRIIENTRNAAEKQDAIIQRTKEVTQEIERIFEVNMQEGDLQSGSDDPNIALRVRAEESFRESMVKANKQPWLGSRAKGDKNHE